VTRLPRAGKKRGGSKLDRSTVTDVSGPSDSLSGLGLQSIRFYQRSNGFVTQ